MADEDEDEDVIVEVARLIWRRGMTIEDFYSALGVDLERWRADGADAVVQRLAGIFDGWSNPPER